MDVGQRRPRSPCLRPPPDCPGRALARLDLDYNQNAKDRAVGSAYSVRPTPDARVSAPLLWEEVPGCEPADFTLKTMPARFAKMGDPAEPIDRSAGSIESLLALSEEQRARGEGDAPWPPHYAKQEGEAPCVAPSRRRKK
jgi:bifunctional non-homologous end joining protein LigD